MRLIHREERDRLLAAAGLDPTDAPIFVVARRLVDYVKQQGADGLDLTDATERAAAAAAVGTADVNTLTKAAKLAEQAGTLVRLP